MVTALSSSPDQVVVCVAEDAKTGMISSNCGNETTDTVTKLGFDLLVAIQNNASSLSLNLGSSAVTTSLLDNSSLNLDGDFQSSSYGVWECGSFDPTDSNGNWNNGVEFCSNPNLASTQNCVTALGAGSESDTSISVPSQCLVPGIVLYFDESTANDPTVTFGTGTPSPEPSSLTLLGFGSMLPLIFRRSWSRMR